MQILLCHCGQHSNYCSPSSTSITFYSLVWKISHDLQIKSWRWNATNIMENLYYLLPYFSISTMHLINLPMLIHDIVKIGEFIGPTLKGKKLWDKKPKKCPKTFKCFYAFLSLLVYFLIDKVIKLWNKTKNRTQIFALWWGFGNLFNLVSLRATLQFVAIMYIVFHKTV